MSSETQQTFVDTLESFKDLRTGISGSRIKRLTSYALEHVKEEETLIPLIINYSKTCPQTHKLGSLYIIDSIGRAYLEEARARDDYIKVNARKGSCAHGLYTLGESMQELLSDALSDTTAEHKEKIRSLVDIWDRAGLFQKGVLNAVRAKFFSMDDMKATPNPSSSSNNSNNDNETQINKDTLPESSQERAKYIINNLKPSDHFPRIDVPSTIFSHDEQEQSQALKELLNQMHYQLGDLSTKSGLNDDARSKSQIQKRNIASPPRDRDTERSARHITTEYGSRRDRERERFTSRRNRSRSPPQHGRRRNSHHDRQQHSGFHNQHQGNQYGGYNDQIPTPQPQQQQQQRNNFPNINNHHFYPNEMNVPSNSHYRQKPISFDPTLPPDHIKVLSRTLFLGGVPMNMKEWDIANILKPYAEVQSLILNNVRKHAFVKVYSRREAENVLMNFNKDGSQPLRTRWGVGFGPRDCCDYQHGYSIIPMSRLTDVDRKWSVGAQWGGTSGQPLQPGMVFEEPDIIVGEGVSSKAISQKMPTDSGRNGPKSGKGSQNEPMMSGYNGEDMYGHPQQQVQPQQYEYGNQQMGYNQPPLPQSNNQQYPQYPPQQIPPQNNFDPTAHLNSLMNMLNQQQPQ